MKAIDIMNTLSEGLKTLSAAVDAGQLTLDESVGFNIGADGSVTLTKGGQVLAICSSVEDAEVVKKWTDALAADITLKRAEEEQNIRKAVKSAKEQLEKLEKKLAEAKVKAEKAAPAEASAEEEDVDDLIDGDEEETVPKTPKGIAPKDPAKEVERLEKDVTAAKKKLAEAEIPLKRLDEQGLVSEKTEMALVAAQGMADQIASYIKKASKQPEFAAAAKQSHKTLPRLIKFVYDKAHDLVFSGHGAAACCVPDNEVFSWIYEYMLRDDLKECQEEEAKEAKQKAEREYNSAKSKADEAKHKATSLRKDANAKKAQAEEATDEAKKAALMEEYEKLNKKADEKKAEADKLFAELPENPNPEKEKGKKAVKKAETSKASTATASAKAKPEAPKKAKKEEADDDMPPIQMSLFDLLGV